MSTVEIDDRPWPTTTNLTDLERLRDARLRAVAWLSDRIADDGTPAGADVFNAWWRAPWALAVGGAPDVAAALLGWVERNALTDDGDLRDGPYGPPGTSSPVYHLSPIVIAASLLARYDVAAVVNSRLEHFRDAESGGAYEHRDFADPQQDMLKTAQLGISALATGNRAQADGVCAWLRRQYQSQTGLPERLYTSWRGGGPVTELTGASHQFQYLVRFDKPRQAYFHSGIAGAFLAGYAGLTGDKEALGAARSYLSLNTGGTHAQFDDVDSVQICKFGWGAAAMHAADPSAGFLPWTVRMGEWFVRRQRADGAWAPAKFLTPEPGVLDLFWKTAEHLMELTYIEAALRATFTD